jgi:hypothetical protein
VSKSLQSLGGKLRLSSLAANFLSKSALSTNLSSDKKIFNRVKGIVSSYAQHLKIPIKKNL